MDRRKATCIYPSSFAQAKRLAKKFAENLVAVFPDSDGKAYPAPVGDFQRPRRRVNGHREAAEAAVRAAFPAVRVVEHYPPPPPVDTRRRVEAIGNLEGGARVLGGGRDLGFVAVYFNPCGYAAPRRNFRAFLERFRWMEGRLLVVELAYGDKPFELTGAAVNLLQLRSDSVLWHKENLINIGTQILRERGFKHVGWLDGDTIINGDGEGWYYQACKALRRKKLVQLCEWIEHRYSDRVIRQQAGVANYLTNDIPVGKVYKTGLGWAVRGDIWDRCGWYDMAIMGSGDRMLFLASVLPPDDLADVAQKITQLKSDSCALLEFSAWAEGWQRAVGRSVAYLPGVEAVGEAHGAHAHRQYYQRELELKASGFSPRKHLARDENGLLCWSADAPESLRQMLVDYFANRKEDE